MPRLALFVDRESVVGVRLIECAACDWYVDYYCYTDPSAHSFGRQQDAYFEVAIHARKARHGLPRVILGARP